MFQTVAETIRHEIRKSINSTSNKNFRGSAMGPITLYISKIETNY
jgi:hypothetical protein